MSNTVRSIAPHAISLSDGRMLGIGDIATAVDLSLEPQADYYIEGWLEIVAGDPPLPVPPDTVPDPAAVSLYGMFYDPQPGDLVFYNNYHTRWELLHGGIPYAGKALQVGSDGLPTWDLISIAELGFDPATQSELDVHAADTTNVHGIADTTKLLISNPSSSATNLIQPTTDAVLPLAVKRASATHSANLIEVQDQTGAVLTSIDKDGRLTIGTGDTNDVWSTFLTGQLAHFVKGTTASPDTTTGPLVKIDRTANITHAQVGGSGDPEFSGLEVAIRSVGPGTDGRVQATAIFANGVSTYGTVDAAGFDGIGRLLAGSTAYAIGGNFKGRKELGSTGSSFGAEIGPQNYATEDAYDGASSAGGTGAKSGGIWMTAAGNFNSAVGLLIGDVFGKKFDIGIANSSHNGGGSIRYFIWDNGNGSASIKISGTHTEGSIIVEAGTGPVIINGSAQQLPGTVLEVQPPTVGDARRLALIGNPNKTGNYSLHIRNGAGFAEYFAAAGVNNVITGTIAGDTGISPQTVGKKFHIGGSISTICVTQDNKLGFFNKTPVAQPAAYTPTNVTPTRTFDATSVSLDTVAQVLATLIQDVQSLGLIG